MNTEHSSETPFPSSAEYGNVVDLVRQVGEHAVREFLDGLAPHLEAVQRGDNIALADLATFLHDAAVSATVIAQAGGLEALHQEVEPASQDPAMTRDEAIAHLEQLSA